MVQPGPPHMQMHQMQQMMPSHQQVQQQMQPQMQQPMQQQMPGQTQQQQGQGQGQGQQQPARPNFQMALLPPPQDRLYPTFEALQADLKAFTRSQGYAMVIISSLNRDPQGQYRRYNLCCSKGGKNYTSHSRGIRQTKSTKTGCPMRIKAIQEKAWPYDDKWHIIVQCAEHNHEPFTGEQGANVPAQFRKIEQDGVRWLMIMHREAQLNLRQLTIGIRVSFGDKYQYVKKSDVRNMLAKIKRDEERKAAAAAAAQGLPANLPYTIIPQAHLPPPPPAQRVEQMPQLPPDMQVPDPDLESDDDGDEI
ncbi:FAR1 domain-containing protein [Madurella fahalii]|uniref:FAR1 domain-containing protein n=1 Tax=Madurella fahalii TaxID=1157608 RepID=A0ABQ0GPL6_9PEZI